MDGWLLIKAVLLLKLTGGKFKLLLSYRPILVSSYVGSSVSNFRLVTLRIITTAYIYFLMRVRCVEFCLNSKFYSNLDFDASNNVSEEYLAIKKSWPIEPFDRNADVTSYYSIRFSSCVGAEVRPTMNKKS